MKAKVILSLKETNEKLADKGYIEFSDSKKDGIEPVQINVDKKYQEFMGFGGAFTEAGSSTLDKLPPEMRQDAIDAYFHPDKGIGYTFCRTHMNSCDFSLGNYAYVEKDGDTELKTFDIERDRKSLIPLIKDSLKTSNSDIKIFSSPWSPPAWMKTNGRMNNGGSLKKEYYETWARYFAKYIKEYQKEGIDLWGITIQNEPMAVTTWDNCIYSDEEERDFVKVIGPILEEEGLGDIKIMVWDHNKDIMKSRVDTIMSDPEAAKWVWGVGFHWYAEEDSKSIVDNSVLDYTYETYKTNLVFTEGCIPYYNIEEENLIGHWWTGEKYARHIIADLNHWTVAWVDWNMYLNDSGGPNHVGNLCDAPIMVDTENKVIHYNSSYYYIAHFSKYILPGAVRVDIENSGGVEITAFENTDGSIAAVIMNDKEENINIQLEIKGKFLEINCKNRSIQTLLITS